MLFFTWLDWDHSTAHVGGSDAGLSGAFADFREDLREALCAFAKGLLFEPNAFAAADAAPAAELLHQLRVLAAALYSYLLWRSDTPQIGWHPVAETRQYEKFAAALLDELSAEWAAPSAGDALFSALPLLDTFAEMREREDACSEEVVRAVTSCRSLFVERRDATARRTSSTRTAVVDDAVGEEAVDEPVEEPVEEAAEVAVEVAVEAAVEEAAVVESAVVEEEAPAAPAPSSTCRGAGSGSTGAGGGTRLSGADRDADRGGTRDGVAGGRHAHVRVDQAAARRDGCRFEDVQAHLGRDRLRPRSGKGPPPRLEESAYSAQRLRCGIQESTVLLHFKCGAPWRASTIRWTAHSRPGHTADGTHLGSHIRFYSHTTLCTSAGMDGMEEEFPEAMRGKNPGGHGGKSSRRDA